MAMKEIPIKELECDEFFKNEIEMQFWRKQMLEKKNVPLPWVNEKNEVIAFYNVFFLLKDTNLENLNVQVKEE